MKGISPLTAEEKKFAESHHQLVFSFLHQRRLNADEYYDVVIFRYLRSVKRYLTIESLQKYAFSTIAFSAMRSAVGNYQSSLRRKQTISLDEPLSNEAKMTGLDLIPDTTVDIGRSVEDKTAIVSLQQNKRYLTVLAIQGYSCKEISDLTETSTEKIKAVLLAAQRQLRKMERC